MSALIMISWLQLNLKMTKNLYKRLYFGLKSTTILCKELLIAQSLLLLIQLEYSFVLI